MTNPEWDSELVGRRLYNIYHPPERAVGLFLVAEN